MNTKGRVLGLLRAQRSRHISGEAIAAELSVSRNAVWKAINALRQEGWEIEAVTNKGYRLADGLDRLSESEIMRMLGQAKELARPEIRIFPSLVSTNQTAKELAVAGAPHGTAVFAEMQTGGRGRSARRFYSPEGGLYCSVILHPDRLHFSHITAVTAFAAVSACAAVEAVSGSAPQIKWVNDLYLSGKKICGILTEAVTDIESGGIGWIVVGIGINLTVPAGGFPDEIRETAGAVFADAPVPDAKNRLAAELLRRLLTVSPPDEAVLYADYRARMMLLGETVTVMRGDREYRALAKDIDSIGHLILQMPDGTEQALSSGEIRIKP